MPEARPVPRSIRVAVVDDELMVRTLLRQNIAYLDGVEFAGEAAEGNAAVELATALSPDVMLVDIRMPGVDGIAATREITRVAPRVRVIGMTSMDADGFVSRMIEAGAAGFLRKDDVDQLETAIRDVASGRGFASPRATTSLIAEVAKSATGAERRDAAERYARLTDREQEVAESLAMGMSVPQIAARLGLSAHTVDTHKKSAMRRAGVANLTLLAILVDRAGFGPAGI